MKHLLEQSEASLAHILATVANAIDQVGDKSVDGAFVDDRAGDTLGNADILVVAVVGIKREFG